MDTTKVATETEVTVEWFTIEVTNYRCTFKIADLELDGGDATAVLAELDRGETPYIGTECLVDYETSENERSWDCDERSVTKVTVAV
jgi:hypothetical protein